MSEAAVEQQRIEYTGIFGKEAADALIDQEFLQLRSGHPQLAYWGKEMLDSRAAGPHLRRASERIGLPVHTAWDIGVTDDAMAIWCFQVYPDHLDIVDYYEARGQGFDHYCEWLDNRGYHGTDWYPHDVSPARGWISWSAHADWGKLILLGRKTFQLASTQRRFDGRHQRRPQDDPIPRGSTRRAPRKNAREACGAILGWDEGSRLQRP